MTHFYDYLMRLVGSKWHWFVSVWFCVTFYAGVFVLCLSSSCTNLPLYRSIMHFIETAHNTFNQRLWILLLPNLCSREDYWAEFYNCLHINPFDDHTKKYFRTARYKWVKARKVKWHFMSCVLSFWNPINVNPQVGVSKPSNLLHCKEDLQHNWSGPHSMSSPVYSYRINTSLCPLVEEIDFPFLSVYRVTCTSNLPPVTCTSNRSAMMGLFWTWKGLFYSVRFKDGQNTYIY